MAGVGRRPIVEKSLRYSFSVRELRFAVLGLDPLFERSWHETGMALYLAKNNRLEFAL